MRRATLGLVGFLLVATLSACGGQGNAAPKPTPTVSVEVIQRGHYATAFREYTSHRTTWVLDTRTEASELKITVVVGSGSCNKIDHLDVVEEDDIVTIEAHVFEEVLPTRGPDGTLYACTADLTVAHATVHLTAPLGDRTLAGCEHVGDCREPYAY